MTAGAWALADRPRGIGALGWCACCARCAMGGGSDRGLRISMVLVPTSTFPWQCGNSSCYSSSPAIGGLGRSACWRQQGGGCGGCVWSVWWVGRIRQVGRVVNGRVIGQRRGHLIPRCPALGSLTSIPQGSSFPGVVLARGRGRGAWAQGGDASRQQLKQIGWSPLPAERLGWLC